MIAKIRSSFRLRLTFIVLLAITIPTAAILVYTISRGVKSIETNAQNLLSAQTDSLTNSITSWDNGVRLAVRNLSQQPDIQGMDAAQQTPALTSMAEIYKDMYLVLTVDAAGNNIARSDGGDLTYYGDREWFKGSMAGNEISLQTVIGRTSDKPALTYSSPIQNAQNKIVGATLAATSLEALTNSVDAIHIGKTGFGYVVDENGVVLAHPDPAYTVGKLVNLSNLPPVTHVLNQESGPFEYTDVNGVVWLTHLHPLDNGWGIVVQQEKADAYAALPSFLIGAIGIIIALLSLIGFLVWFATGRAISPIFTLTDAATAVAKGNLQETVTITRMDEIGTLATAFNTMTDQLRNLVGNLEQRVTDRTKDLALANEVGRNISEIRDAQQVLAEAVKVIRNEFDLYLAQIYMVEANRATILLQAAEGQNATRLLAQGHFLAINTASINGTAVSQKRAVVVSNTRQDPRFRPNPLLPDTYSEMAVPLLVADKVIGVLDLQSTIANTFTEENVPAFTAMASQLAIALENATLFNEREKATTEMEAALASAAQQAQRLTALNKMGADLAATNQLATVYQIIGSQILAIVAGSHAAIALLKETPQEAEIITLANETDVLPTGTFLPLAGTAVGLAIQENRILQLPKEAPMSAYSDSRQLAQQGLQSILITPLSASGQMIGTLNIGSTQPYAFSEADVSLVQQAATLLATTIDSLLLIERVQRLASIVENHPDFIGIGTLEGKAVYINPTGLAKLGLPPGYDVSNMRAADFYTTEDAEILEQVGIPTALQTGFWTGEAHLRKADGAIIPVEQTIAINYDAQNVATGFSITMHDITTRQAAAEAQRTLAAQLEERLLQVNTLQRAMTHEGWSAFLTSDRRLVQGYKFDNEQINLISTRDVQRGNVPTLAAPEAEADTPPDSSTVTLPVAVRGETIGVIGVRNADGTSFNENQRTMLAALSQQVANALDRARLFEEMELARKQMDSLYAGSERVVRASSIEEVLVALVESTELKRMDRASLFFFDRAWDDVPPETMRVTAVWEKNNVVTNSGSPVGTILPVSLFPSLHLVNKNKPALFPDILADERLGLDAKMLAEKYGVTSVMFFPLVVTGQWLGVLMIQSVTHTKLTDDNVRQISGLVDQAASVSQTQRLFEQSQSRARREQLLREVTAKVYAAPDAEAILKTAVKEVNRIMGVDSFVYLDAPSPNQPPSDNGHALLEESATQEG